MRKKPVSRLPRAGARPPADGTQEKAPPAPALLERYLGRNGLPVTLGLVSLLIVVIFHDFLAGNVYYLFKDCLLYTSPSPRDRQKSRMPSSA